MTDKSPRVSEKLRGAIRAMDRAPIAQDNAKALLIACADTIDALHNEKVYLEATLLAATTGELPERFDLNQLLYAQRARSYIAWLGKTKDPNDKLRPEGTNEAMISQKGTNQ